MFQQVGVLCLSITVSTVFLAVRGVDLFLSVFVAFDGVLRSLACAQKSLVPDSSDFEPRRCAKMLRVLMSVSLDHQWLGFSVVLEG